MKRNMITAKKSPFEQAVSYLAALKPAFEGLPRCVTDSVNEIRLRAGQPVTLECTEKRIRLGKTAEYEQINECVREFCEHSVHSYEKQFREGWITLKGGHRAGFTGTAVIRNGKVETVRDVSSVNLRIAKQYIGCGTDLYLHVFDNCNNSNNADNSNSSNNSEKHENFSGLLIIGKPMSAKTTVLRDLCRLISANGKVALIDERSEIAAAYNGVPSLDVGENTDVLNNFPKGDGIMAALRNLSPEYVICDEIGRETEQITSLANSGVKMILTAHSGSLGEAYSSKRIKAVLETGGISHIAVLGHGKNIGKVEFYGTNKYYGNRGGFGVDYGDGNGSLFLLPLENAGGSSR